MTEKNNRPLTCSQPPPPSPPHRALRARENDVKVRVTKTQRIRIQRRGRVCPENYRKMGLFGTVR